MAATVSSSVWGTKSKPGAWALDAEEHDEELRLSLQSAVAASVHPEPPSSDFPTLAAAAATKTKKKKPQTFSISEFASYTAPKSADSQRLTTNELINLPTGPRERTAEELERSRSGFGGGFRNYGQDSANPRARVSDRGNRDRSGDDGLSRADEDDDWSKAKRSVGGNGAGGDRREKVGFFNSSRADDVDNWGSNKSYTPSEGRMGRRSDSFSSSGGADSDNWGRKKEENNASITGGQRFERERRGVGFESSGASDSDNWLKNKKEQPTGAVDGARPRLNLQPRTLPVSNGDGSQDVKPKASNPFGDARPRELVLKEKGQDWKEIDEKLDALKVKEVDGAAGAWKKGPVIPVNVKDDSTTEKKTWKKWGTPPTASVDKVENGDAVKAEEVADEKTENGEAANK